MDVVDGCEDEQRNWLTFMVIGSRFTNMKDTITDKVVDPTAQMMRDYLKSKQFSMYEFSDFDVEGAIFWFATFHHSGMMSNLYSASSTSKYSPSCLANGPEEESSEKDAFDLLESQFI